MQPRRIRTLFGWNGWMRFLILISLCCVSWPVHVCCKFIFVFSSFLVSRISDKQCYMKTNKYKRCTMFFLVHFQWIMVLRYCYFLGEYGFDSPGKYQFETSPSRMYCFGWSGKYNNILFFFSLRIKAVHLIWLFIDEVRGWNLIWKEYSSLECFSNLSKSDLCRETRSERPSPW